MGYFSFAGSWAERPTGFNFFYFFTGLGRFRHAFRAGRKPPYIEALTPDLLSALKSKVQSTAWGDSIAAETSLTPYHGMLIVFAPASTQREVSLALQEMNR